MATTDSVIFGVSNELTSGNALPINRDARIVGVLCFVLFLLGTTGNALVILAVLSCKRLQTASSAFIVNLASADFISSLIMPMLTAVQWVRYHTSSVESLCVFVNVVINISSACSFLTIAAIALCRYTLIVSPRRFFPLVFGGKMLFIWITSLWIFVSAVVVLPPFVFDIGKFGFDPVASTCSSLPEYHSAEIFDKFLVFVFTPVPMFIVIFCYVGILIKITIHNRRLRASMNGFPGNQTGVVADDPGTSRVDNSLKSSISPTQVAVTRNMFFVFCAFVICLTPHAMCALFGKCPLGRYTTFVTALNSVVNPFIYGFNHPIFRQVFISFFRRRPVHEPTIFYTNTISRFQRPS